MLTVEEALKQLLEYAKPIQQGEPAPITYALNRILAEDQCSAINVPPADNSAMDGYAIDIYDLAGLEDPTLPVSQTIAAGHPPLPHIKGTAARIFTGAEIPEGANAVVMQEHCKIIEPTRKKGNKHHVQQVKVPGFVSLNNNIRHKGQDIKVGTTILEKGHHIRPQDIGLLASIGIAEVLVNRQITVAILSTGDELAEPNMIIGSGKIYNSNRYLLQGFLRSLSGVTVLDLGSVKDNRENTMSAFERASEADCIISTGGVSVGDEDHVKFAVEQLGSIDFWRIAIKPGKPLAFGQVNQVPFFGLPGNPASVFITFLLFVRPFILRLQNKAYQNPTGTQIAANFSWKENPQRQE